MNFLLNIFRLIWNSFQKLTPKVYDIAPLPKVDEPVIRNPILPDTLPNDNPPPKYLWDTFANSRHSVRLICDEQGLSLKDKNIICAVIQAESNFNNKATNQNKNSKGQVTSTDWGICQINDYYNIGQNKTFISVQYILDNPDKVVEFMIEMFEKGNLTLWVAFNNKSYLKYM